MDPERIGRFRVIRVLGAGSFATVWLAQDEELDSSVAIKVLAENWSRDENARRRFLDEARALRAIDSDRITRVYDIGELEDGRPYIVTEFADRGSLAERMQARRASGEPFAIDEAIALSVEIAECLVAAHDRSIIHRDLKPSNILFRSIAPEEQAAAAREGRTVKAEKMLLADFGIARRLEAGGAGRTMVVGTPHYMAPEQAEPETATATNERADIYAAAVVLYELLAGIVPYPYDSIVSVIRAARESGPPAVGAVRAGVPDAVNSVLRQGLAIEPSDRFSSARTWRDALRSTLGSATRPPAEPVIAPMPSGTETITDSRRTPHAPAAATIVPGAAASSAPSASEPVSAGGGGRKRSGFGGRAIAFILALGLGGGAVVGLLVARNAQAAEVTLEATASTGPDPFYDPGPDVVTPSASASASETRAPTPLVSETPDVAPSIATNIGGRSVPLYGGTGIISVCDKKKLTDFLTRNVDKARAWARVAGISIDQIGDYVSNLSRLILNVDTRVTNHGFRNGLATARQSLLQKGTAVLVDLLGRPRVRCKCGNPLLPSQLLKKKPKYVGIKWVGFDPRIVVAAFAPPTTALPTAASLTPSANPTRTVSVKDVAIDPRGTYNGFAREISCSGFFAGKTIPFTVSAQIAGSQLTLTFKSTGGDTTTTQLTIFENLSFKGIYTESGISWTISGRFAANRIIDGRVETKDCSLAWSGTR